VKRDQLIVVSAGANRFLSKLENTLDCVVVNG
jgi:hypothetical protein